MEPEGRVKTNPKPCLHGRVKTNPKPYGRVQRYLDVGLFDGALLAPELLLQRPHFFSQLVRLVTLIEREINGVCVCVCEREINGVCV